MKINVVKNVLGASKAAAEDNRRLLAEAGVLAINLMSSPGSGKTTLLEKTIPQLPPGKSAVLVGDLQTTRDAERLGAARAAAVTQINTGRGCHLSPAEVAEGLADLPLAELDYLFIENVGNMVCPAAFDLGEHLRVVMLSAPEGDDKVAKYPTLFQGAHAVLLTKMDLADVLGFRMEQVIEDLDKLNTAAPRIPMSPKTGQGLDEWLVWLTAQRAALDE